MEVWIRGHCGSVDTRTLWKCGYEDTVEVLIRGHCGYEDIVHTRYKDILNARALLSVDTKTEWIRGTLVSRTYRSGYDGIVDTRTI